MKSGSFPKWQRFYDRDRTQGPYGGAQTSLRSHSRAAVSSQPSRNLIAGCFSFICLLLGGLSTGFLIPLLQDDTRPFLPSSPITGLATLIPPERRAGLLWLLLICSIKISTLPVLRSERFCCCAPPPLPPLLFSSLSPPFRVAVFLCVVFFYLSTVKASQMLLGFVVRKLYLPKGGISE